MPTVPIGKSGTGGVDYGIKKGGKEATECPLKMKCLERTNASVKCPNLNLASTGIRLRR